MSDTRQDVRDPSKFGASGTIRMQPIDWSQHTMGLRLIPYLELKIHSLIQRHDWRSIEVIGEYDRLCEVSEVEKNDKMFNWQRPTADLVAGTLRIKCFPGRNYVLHYALIIATYLAIKNRFRDHVSYRLPPARLSHDMMERLTLPDVFGATVVIGWAVEHLAGTDGWTLAETFAWKRLVVNGSNVFYLGFFHSIWGDVAGALVTRLANLGVARVLYVGKVGALFPSVHPNTMLASGKESLVEGLRVQWSDAFHDIERERDVILGLHVSSPSILLETRSWLDRHRSYSFVDPEIGQMGRAARDKGVPFGFLHIISNNLSASYADDLSNERNPQVLMRRRHLIDRVGEIIQNQLARMAPG